MSVNSDPEYVDGVWYLFVPMELDATLHYFPDPDKSPVIFFEETYKNQPDIVEYLRERLIGKLQRLKDNPVNYWALLAPFVIDYRFSPKETVGLLPGLADVPPPRRLPAARIVRANEYRVIE